MARLVMFILLFTYVTRNWEQGGRRAQAQNGGRPLWFLASMAFDLPPFLLLTGIFRLGSGTAGLGVAVLFIFWFTFAVAFLPPNPEGRVRPWWWRLAKKAAEDMSDGLTLFVIVSIWQTWASWNVGPINITM